MSQTHIEAIRPHERLSPALGGTGYLPPERPATRAELLDDLLDGVKRCPGLNAHVWKVSRDSVRWDRTWSYRRLSIDGSAIPCVIIGSVKDWWFVSVEPNVAKRLLERTN